MNVLSSQAKVGVKAVIIRDRHLLTVVKRYPEGVAYILPGGSQNHGETLPAAVQRECLEELGAHVHVERLLFVREYIGAHHQHADIDSHIHIVDVLFACHVADEYTAQMGTEPDFDQVGVEWLPLASLQNYCFYPAALGAYLQQMPHEAQYIGDIN